jgi:23S rRNA (pseudouridine1915-N3)-methyltransferase
MQIKLITIGNKMPAWINEGFAEYAKRMPPHLPIKLIDIPLPTRTKNSVIDKLKEQEGELMLKQIHNNDYVIACAVSGKEFSTEQLSKELIRWQTLGKNICILIGGPDGLSPACLQRADATFSFSKLTLPHPLVRVLLAEQLYRAWSLSEGLPYHR